MLPPDLSADTLAAVELVPQLDLDGRQLVVVLVKERFVVDRDGVVERTNDAEIRPVDEPWDEPPQSLKLPSDVCVRKPRTDVVVAAKAMARDRAPVRSLDVLVRVGPVEKLLRVHGTRVWYRTMNGLGLTPPEPFEDVELRWDLAWGGCDFEEGRKPLEEARNPVGRGVVRVPSTLVHQPGPQIEDPRAPITAHASVHEPAGIAPIGRHWEPRRRYVGTMDELWRKERLPLLPADFDDRHNQCAPPYLIAPGRLRGGELVQLGGLCADGALQFELPRIVFYVGSVRDDGAVEHRAELDTVLLLPNERALEMTWRAVVPMTHPMRRVREVVVYEKEQL